MEIYELQTQTFVVTFATISLLIRNGTMTMKWMGYNGYFFSKYGKLEITEKQKIYKLHWNFFHSNNSMVENAKEWP